MNIQERLTAFAMLGAGWVLWLLVALSVVCLAIVLERAYVFLSSRDDVRSLRAEILKRLRKGDVDGAKKRLSSSRSYEARVVEAGIGAMDEGAAAVEEKLAGETAMAKLQMERNLAFLGTVGNNAPFVGLLGTVIGVIRAFHELDQSSGQVTQGLMTQIGEALVATAIGILVALPAVAFFNLYHRVIRGRLTRADSLGREVMAIMKAERPATEPDEPEAEAAE